jgi:hypothetical protein
VATIESNKPIYSLVQKINPIIDGPETNTKLWLGILALVLCIFWVIHTIVKESHSRSFLMPALSLMGTAIFPGMRNEMGYSGLIQVVLLIDEGRRGAVLGYCI